MSQPDTNGRDTKKEDYTDNAGPHHIHYPFWFGGSASCFAASVTHPLDLSEPHQTPSQTQTFEKSNAHAPTHDQVRLQTRTPDGPKGMFGTFVHILKNDSVLGLYRGLSASLLRQLTYSTTRFGIYSELKETFTTTLSTPSFLSLLAMASTSGLIGGVAGNPADVLNVRMQHDAALPPAQRRNYRNAVDGLYRMWAEEGWRSGFRGVGANSLRAVLMTASQLASYDSFKRVLLERAGMEDTLTTHFAASFLAGFVATTVCSPVDVVKTRVMSARQKEGVWRLLQRITREEGVRWVFRGWVPAFVRLGPHTVATFLFLEQHKKWYRRMKGLGEDDGS